MMFAYWTAKEYNSLFSAENCLLMFQTARDLQRRCMEILHFADAASAGKMKEAIQGPATNWGGLGNRIQSPSRHCCIWSERQSCHLHVLFFSLS